MKLQQNEIEDQTRSYYWGANNKAIHYEILKAARPKGNEFLGENKNDRHNAIGQLNKLRQKFEHFFRSGHNPAWDVYHTVQYVGMTEKVTRDEFADQVKNTDKSINELAEQFHTFPEVVEKRINQLENRKLGEDVYFTANLAEYWEDFKYDRIPYDFVIDIDGDEALAERQNISKDEVKEEYSFQEIIKAAYKEAEQIKTFFDNNNVPYSLKFSGGKGFHFRISRKDMLKADMMPEGHNFREFSKPLAEMIAKETGAIIDRNIYSENRIFRTPYSIHTKTGLVCLPLTDKQFENFETGIAHPEKVKELPEVKDTSTMRGYKTREGDFDRLLEYLGDYKPELFEEKEEETEETNKGIDYGKVERVYQDFKKLNKEEKEAFDKMRGGN